MNPRIDLVTTASRIAKDFGPATAAQVCDSCSVASYEVDLGRVKSQFARFLVQHVTSTALQDPGSRIVLVYAETIGECKADEWLLSPTGRASDDLRLAAASGPSALASALETLADQIRQQGDDGTWPQLRTGLFRWPAYGSPAVRAHTPEAYFDACAAALRTSGCIPVAIGPMRARPPESVLRNFIKSDVIALAARFEREQAVQAGRPVLKAHRGHLKLVGRD